jgi:hypothetical protein
MKNFRILSLMCFITLLSIFITTTPSSAFGILGDINDDDKLGLEEAFYALQVTAGAKPQSVNPLQGIWRISGLASGPGAPWWGRGTMEIGSNGSFSAAILHSDGTTGTMAGKLDLSNSGIVTLADRPSFRGHMDLDKRVMVWTDTWSAGEAGTTQLDVLTKKGKTSYSMTDLVGQWDMHELASGPGAPWWIRGTITIEADGSSSGTLEEYQDDPDNWSASWQITNDGIITRTDHVDNHEGYMGSERTIWVDTGNWSGGLTETTILTVFTKKGDDYSMADLAGTWAASGLATGPGGPWWIRAHMMVQPDGSFSVTTMESDGNTEVSLVNLDISNEGVIRLIGSPSYKGNMDSKKTFMVWTGTWESGAPGTTEIIVFTKISN